MQDADATFKRVPRASKYLPVIESFTREKWVKILSGARGFCEEAKTSKNRQGQMASNPIEIVEDGAPAYFIESD